MLATQHKSYSNILVTEINGKFSRKDFNNIFVSQVKNILESFSEVHVFLDFDDELSGWKVLSLLNQFQQYLEPYGGINRIAIISDSCLLKWRLIFNKLDSSHPIERFVHKDIEKAKAWLAIG